MDRKQKIELLKGIASGSRSIEETMPQSVVVRYLSYNIAEDAYHEYLTGEIIPGKVYREKHKRLLKNPNRILIGMDLENPLLDYKEHLLSLENKKNES